MNDNANSDFREAEICALPAEWDVTTIGDVLEPRGESMQPSPNGKTRYVGLEHIDSGNTHLTRWGIEGDVKSTKNKFYRDDLLYGKLRPYLDKAVLAEWDGVCATDILVFVVNQERANPPFLASRLHTSDFLNHAISTTTGVNHPRTSWQALRAFALALPPLPEQRAIARVLSTIQRAIETQDNLIAAARELKKSLMRQLFTQGMDANGAVKETEIGVMPEHWDVVKLGDIAEIRGGKRLPKGHKFSEKPTPYPYIRVVDLKERTVESNELKFLTPEDYHSIRRYTISSDDIYISIAGTIGAVGIIPDDLDGANLTENAAKITIKNRSKLDKHFAMFFLDSEAGQSEISRRTAKTSQPKLALVRVQQIPMPCPPLSEQCEIARILATVDKKIETEEKRKTALQTLFKTMLQQLMTGQIRVTHLLNGKP